MANFKYVPTFESFIGSPKLNEAYSKGALIDGIEKIMNSGVGIKKAYDQMKKSGLLKFRIEEAGLKVLDHDFNGVLIRIKTSLEYGYTSINVWEHKDKEEAMSTHKKEHGFPLDTDSAAVILNDDKYSIFRGQWESKKAKARKWKVRDFLSLSESGDYGLGGDEADSKWSSVLDVMKASSLDDLVWLGTYFPEIVEEEGKMVDSYDLDGFGDEDPHGDVSISVFKWKGMLLASHDDDYQYSGTLCNVKDAVKLAKLLEGDEGIDIGE